VIFEPKKTLRGTLWEWREIISWKMTSVHYCGRKSQTAKIPGKTGNSSLFALGSFIDFIPTFVVILRRRVVTSLGESKVQFCGWGSASESIPLELAM